LHLLRLPRRVRAADNDFPADWMQRNARVGGDGDDKGKGENDKGGIHGMTLIHVNKLVRANQYLAIFLPGGGFLFDAGPRRGQRAQAQLYFWFAGRVAIK